MCLDRCGCVCCVCGGAVASALQRLRCAWGRVARLKMDNGSIWISHTNSTQLRTARPMEIKLQQHQLHQVKPRPNLCTPTMEQLSTSKSSHLVPPSLLRRAQAAQSSRNISQREYEPAARASSWPHQPLSTVARGQVLKSGLSRARRQTCALPQCALKGLLVSLVCTHEKREASELALEEGRMDAAQASKLQGRASDGGTVECAAGSSSDIACARVGARCVHDR